MLTIGKKVSVSAAHGATLAVQQLKIGALPRLLLRSRKSVYSVSCRTDALGWGGQGSPSLFACFFYLIFYGEFHYERYI